LPLTHRNRLWLAVIALLVLQAVLALTIVHRESLTFDEDDHMFAGYMMWKTADYGLNPEHPPLVKLLATIPVLGEALWVPPLQGRDFKTEAYLDGRDWLARNDGGSQRLVFRMRASAELLALGLCMIVFLSAREWFGDTAGLVALALVVFDPNILAHSALVTTDVGVSLFFVASTYTFHRYATRPTPLRLVIAALSLGLLLATKHSGILFVPMLFLLIAWEIFTKPKLERKRALLRFSGAVVAIGILSGLVLWSFYGFRYAARPAGQVLSTSLVEYAAPLSQFQSAVVLGVAHLHLLPESYLMGLVDVKRMAAFYPTFLLGKVYAHGQWYYFPLVILIKTTLGMLALLCLSLFAMVTHKIGKRRELIYVFVPAIVYLVVAMVSGMNIGARHLLPMYAFTTIFAAAGVAAQACTSRRWAIICVMLVAAHILSSLLVFPNEMAYANEAAGGPENLHNLLSDANVDWAQQLLQVKQWEDRHSTEECWFAYFARPEIDPAVYGIRCHALPTADTSFLGGEEIIPPSIQGTVLISAGDLSGCEWPSGKLNAYRSFQSLRPDEIIDNSVFVYRGTFAMPDASAVARAQRSGELLSQKQPNAALDLAREAAAIAPDNIFAQTALGDAAAASGNKQEAQTAWQAAIEIAKQLEPDAQPSFVPDLEAKIKRQNQEH
jgi:4-amino-4-deoxy-L-arabinose transferase-like glycosyltransferase